MKPKVLMLAPAFAPFANPEAIVNSKLALAFISHGWDVDIISLRIRGNAAYEYVSEWDEIWKPLQKYIIEIEYPVVSKLQKPFVWLDTLFKVGYPVSGARWVNYAACQVIELNTVIDSLLNVADRVKNDVSLRNQLDKVYSFLNPKKRLILVTGHRRENFGDGFESICFALTEIALNIHDVEILYPVHLNPNVQVPVKRILGQDNLKNIHLIEPVDYLLFVYLMCRSHLIITDSGGYRKKHLLLAYLLL
jgi:UDP-N-acetylglucosamine 2-epimerase